MPQRARAFSIILSTLLLVANTFAAQGLAELARRERERRAAIGQVRFRIEMVEPQKGLSPQGAEDSASADSAKGGSPVLRSTTSGHSNQPKVDPQQNHLLSRGPVVWRELQQTNQKLLDLKKELSELERVTTPVWQRGRFLENTELARRRREIRSCQERILKLEAEWRQLQDTARRLGLAPGLLRGTH